MLTGSAALVYPILLPDRLELLVSTQSGIERVSVAVPGRRVKLIQTGTFDEGSRQFAGRKIIETEEVLDFGHRKK